MPINDFNPSKKPTIIQTGCGFVLPDKGRYTIHVNDDKWNSKLEGYGIPKSEIDEMEKHFCNHVMLIAHKKDVWIYFKLPLKYLKMFSNKKEYCFVHGNDSIVYVPKKYYEEIAIGELP